MQENLEKLLSKSQKLHVLYVEDDIVLLEKTNNMFKNIFNDVQVATNGKEGFELYKKYFEEKEKYFDIVITDIRMPIMDGTQLAKNIKKIHPAQLIIITSAHDESKDLIEFINIGIKKFLKKPFTFGTIIETFLDVCNEFDAASKEIIIDKNYSWNCACQQLYCDNVFVKLSQNEIIILELLLNNPNQIFSNDDFYYIIKNENYEKDFSINSIKSMIKRLRKKLPETFIENIYGSGYRINSTTFLNNLKNNG